MDAIMSFLIEKWPIIGIMAIVAIVTVLICRFYYKRFLQTEKKANGFESKIDESLKQLPCTKHDEAFTKILEEITTIRTFLITKNPKSANVFSQKASPRRLNDEGINLFNDISGQEFLNNNSDFLIRCMEEKNPKTALDVETSASEVLYENLDKDIFNKLKLWVYNSPTRRLTFDGVEKDYAITMDDVCFIISLPLRDLFLLKHNEIEQ